MLIVDQYEPGTFKTSAIIEEVDVYYAQAFFITLSKVLKNILQHIMVSRFLSFYNILWFQDFYNILWFQDFMTRVLMKNESHFLQNGETFVELTLLRRLVRVIEAVSQLSESKKMPRNLDKNCG